MSVRALDAGQVLQGYLNSVEWAPFAVYIPTAELNLVLGGEGYAYGSPSTVLLDALSVAAPNNDPVSIAEALDTPGMEWTTGGAIPWTGTRNVTADGSDALTLGIDATMGQREGWLESTVTGPGVLTMRMRPGKNYLWVFIDGEAVEMFRDASSFSYLLDAVWQSRRIPIPAGSHVVRLQGGVSSYSSDRPRSAWETAGFDEFVFTTNSGIPLGEALDQPSWTWTMTGEGPLAAVTAPEPGATGGSAAFFQMPAVYKYNELRTNFSGAGFLSWTVKGSGHLSLTCQGITGEVSVRANEPPRRFCVIVRPGATGAVWTFTRDFEVGRLMMDDVQLTPLPAITLGEALEASALPWTTSGYGAVPVADLGMDGGDAVLLPRWTDGFASLRARVEGPGVIRFAAQAAAGAHGQFYLDTVALASISRTAPNPWAEYRFDIPAGEHTLTWRGEAQTALTDEGLLLDRVSWQPQSEVSLAEALDLPAGITVSTSEDLPWLGLVPAAEDGTGDAARAPEMLRGDASWVDVTLQGPALVHWKWKRSGDMLLDFQRGQSPISAGLSWGDAQTLTGPGSSTLRFIARRGNYGDPGVAWLDEMRVLPADITLDEALDTPGAGWTAAAAAEVVAVSAMPVARPGDADGVWLAPNQSVSAAFEGPGDLTVSARNGNSADLGIALNGAAAAILAQTPPDAEGWFTRTVFVPPGRQTIAVRAGSSGNWVDRVTWAPLPQGSTDDAVEATGLTLATSGEGRWLTTRDAAPGHEDCLAAVFSVSGERAFLTSTITGPATVRFQYNANTTANLAVSVDWMPVLQPWLSNWYQYELQVPAGTHTVRWLLVAQRAGTSGSVDSFTVTSGAPFLSAAAVAGFPLPLGHTGLPGGSADPAGGPQGGSSWRWPANDGPRWETFAPTDGRLRFWARNHVTLHSGDRQIATNDSGGGWNLMDAPLREGTLVRWGTYNFSGTEPSISGLEWVPGTAATSLAQGAVSGGATLSGGGGPQDEWAAVIFPGHDPAIRGNSYMSPLTATVNGPAVVSFRGSLHPRPGSLTYSGGVQFRIDGPNAGSDLPYAGGEFYVGAGPHTLSWTPQFSGVGGATVWISGLRITPVESVSLAASTGQPSLPWSALGMSGVSWGTDAAQRAAMADAGVAPCSLTTTLHGPGTLDFWVTGTVDPSRWRVLINGVKYPLSFHGTTWDPISILRSGSVTVTWECDSPFAGFTGDFRFGVQRVSWKPLATIPLATALDGESLDWSGSDSAWGGIADATQAFDGVDAATPGVAIPGESKPLVLRVTGPGLLRYRWKITRDPRDSYNGNESVSPPLLEQFVSSGPLNILSTYEYPQDLWHGVEVDIPAGPQTVTWRMTATQAGMIAPGMAGWVDDVSFHPGELPLAAAVDQGAGSFAITGPVTVAAAEESHDGTDALYFAPNAVARMSTRITGPALVRGWWKPGGDGAMLHLAALPDFGSQFVPGGSTTWRPFTWLLPLEGPVTVTATFYEASRPVDGAWLDEWEVTPLTSGTLATPGITFAPHPWASLATFPPHSASPALWTTGGNSSLTATVSNGGVFSFEWFSVEPAWVAFVIDGLTHSVHSGNGWQSVQARLALGPHALTWQTRSDTGGGFLTGLREISMDATQPALTLAEAADTTADLPAWSSAPAANAQWLPVAAGPAWSRSGGDAVSIVSVSGSSTQGALSAQITGPGTLKYWWRMASAAQSFNAQNPRDVIIIIGGGNFSYPPVPTARAGSQVLTYNPPAPGEWVESAIRVPAGAQTVTWSLEKQVVWNGTSSIASGYRAAVDQISWEPLPSGYFAWLESHRAATAPGAAIESLAWEAAADADGDGIANAIEYARGTNPLVPSGALATMFQNDGRRIVWPEIAAKSDLQLAAESSVDLLHWLPATLEFTGNPAQAGTAAAPNSPHSNAPVLFFRLKASLANP